MASNVTNKIFYANLGCNEAHKFMVGDIVQLIGLKTRPHWNGKLATIKQPFVKAKGRWLVELNDILTQALIKTKNLQLIKKTTSKTIDQSVIYLSYLVFGYIRNLNNYNNDTLLLEQVPPLIGHICMKYYLKINTMYYELLKVQCDATDKEIKKGYRKQALKWHPDKYYAISKQDAKQANELFKKISIAYEILSNPQRRKEYDLFGEQYIQQKYFTRDLDSVFVEY